MAVVIVVILCPKGWTGKITVSISIVMVDGTNPWGIMDKVVFGTLIWLICLCLRPSKAPLDLKRV